MDLVLDAKFGSDRRTGWLLQPEISKFGQNHNTMLRGGLAVGR